MIMSTVEESLHQVRHQTTVCYRGQEPHAVTATKRFDQAELNQQSPLLLCRLQADGYVQVPHLVTGDTGAIALGATCFRPRDDNRPGDKGLIMTGSNWFAVSDVVLIDGVVFHLGRVTRGGFHIDKAHGLRLRIALD